jgi:hypothetical protein
MSRGLPGSGSRKTEVGSSGFEVGANDLNLRKYLETKVDIFRSQGRDIDFVPNRPRPRRGNTTSLFNEAALVLRTANK